MTVHPILLSALLVDAVRMGVEKAAAHHALGAGVLVAELPSDVSLPSRSTRLAVRANTPAIARAGLSLDMVAWPLKKRTFSLAGTELTVGRDPENDIVVPHAAVSKLHARIAVDAKEAHIWDAGSANGTRVEDSAATRDLPVLLTDRAVVRLGEMPLLFFRPSTLLELLLA